MKQFVFLMVGILLLLGGVHGQADSSKTKLRFLQFGGGYTLQKAKDDGMSPLLYRGSAGGLLFGYAEESQKHLQFFEAQGHFGQLKNRFNPDFSAGEALVLRIDASYTNVRFISKIANDKIDWYVGGAISSIINNRYHNSLNNSSLNYGSYNGLGVVTAFRSKLSWFNRSFEWMSRIHVPVLTYVIRPNYITLFEYTDPDYNAVEDLTDDAGFHTFNHFFRLDLRHELSYILPNGNRIKLGYFWDLYRYNQVNKVQAAGHYLQISLLSKF